MKLPLTVIIKGAGDLASGVAHRLFMAGFKVIMLELLQPLVVRRSVAFASAVFEGEMEIEGVKAVLVENAGHVNEIVERGIIPVVVDPQGAMIRKVCPDVLVDAVMAKKNTGTSLDDAPVVIGLGPGFVAGVDVHAVVETIRGHDLGKVIYSGSAAENTGVPGSIEGYTKERLLRAPAPGLFIPLKEIGDPVEKGETVAMVGDAPVIAELNGVLRGLLYPGLEVKKGMKLGDIDPRGKDINWHTISDKARAVAGGVLEAVLHLGWGTFGQSK